MTRRGKIARLPALVRKELNLRLDEGEEGTALVAWLNGLPEVRAVLARGFDGKDITEQNLTAWRQGGFRDWQRQQEAVDCVHGVAELGRGLAAETGAVPLTDVFSASVALLLTKLMRDADAGGKTTAVERREMLALIREWTALRRADHKAARLQEGPAGPSAAGADRGQSRLIQVNPGKK